MFEVGWRQGEWWDWEDSFAAHVQPFPAGHQVLQLWAVSKQICHCGRGRRHLLEVVEDQKHLLIPYLRFEVVQEQPVALFTQANGSGDDRQNGFEVTACSEVDEVDPVPEVVTQVSGCLQCQASLAGATGAQQGEQPRPAEPFLDLLELAPATYETVERGREVARRCPEPLFGWRLEALAEQHHQVVFDQFAQLFR
jgi:hypothetical protein